MLLRGCRLFGVALHREPKGTKRLQKILLHLQQYGVRSSRFLAQAGPGKVQRITV